jgi:mannose-6-phosphate isomerase
MFYELASIAKNYAWGTPGALSRFTGASDSNLPEAELWFGDHASSQCTITVEGTEQSLASWLSTTGNSFPLLVKLLAASQPLSIQVHPNAEVA